MTDHLIRAIAREHNVRVAGVITTRLVAEGAARHQLSPAATCAVGRALTSGLLLATLTKGGERVTVLPDGGADSVREVQHALRTGALYDLLAGGERSAEALATRLYAAEPLEPIGAERAVRFRCRCSAQKIGDALQLLGTVDLDEMIAE